ncbi:MAG: protoheme IX farnesyltransferase [Candidatus Odinarchaeota archaeon]
MTNVEKQSFSTVAKSNAPSILVIPLNLYGQLIKAKQTFLLLYTAILVYLISAWNSEFSLVNLVVLSVSLFLAISGSTLLNMYIDRDIDAVMERTKARALPSYRVHPNAVLIYGLGLTFTGVLLSGLFLNTLTMIAVFLGFFFDVVVYSLLLKRRTRYSIIFGGIAGGLPAIAGRTAAIGTVDALTLLLGLFVITWIPLHILTLATIPKNLEGYKKARVPMWPVVSGTISANRVVTISAIATCVVVSLAGISLEIHVLTFIPLILFSGYLIYLSVINLSNPSDRRTFKIFKLASMFMALSFLWLYIGLILASTLP